MLRRGLLTLALVLTLAFVVVPIASADPCCHDNGSNCNPVGGAGGTGGNGNGQGGGVGNQCQAAPEAPDALAFPLAAAVVIGGYLLLTRRRRPADQ